MLIRALPNFFTIGNLFLGVMSIVLATNNYGRYAAMMIIIGMFLDSLDGRVARMLNAQSEFGKELDSLSDVISFGVAPSIVMYIMVFKDLPGPEGWLITAIFPICGALRLAKFNVVPGIPGYFIGLPITAAGGILATMTLYKGYISPNFFILGMLMLSYLMVSRIKYPSFKSGSIPRFVFWIIPLFIIGLGFLTYYYPNLLTTIMVLPLLLYVLYGIKTTITYNKDNKSDKTN